MMMMMCGGGLEKPRYLNNLGRTDSLLTLLAISTRPAPHALHFLTGVTPEYEFWAGNGQSARNQAEMVRKCRGCKFFAKRSVWFEFQPNRTKDHKVEAPVQFHPEGSLLVAGALHVGLDVPEEVGHVLRGVQIWNNLFLEICNSAGN